MHESVELITEQYSLQERRNVYTTPKSYLELIHLYKRLLAANEENVDALKTRLATGLVKLRSSAAQVAETSSTLTLTLTTTPTLPQPYPNPTPNPNPTPTPPLPAGGGDADPAQG